jgi:hypothetical protein
MNPKSEKKGESINIGLALVRIWAMTLYAPLRIKMGRDHIGYAGLLGLVLIFFYAGLNRAIPLLVLIPILILHYFCQSLSGFQERRRGIVRHTWYGGVPWIAMRLMFTKNESVAKQFGEPLIVLVLGCFMWEDWPSVAKYFWWGAAAMVFNNLVLEDMERRRTDQMSNAQIEAEYYTQRR